MEDVTKLECLVDYIMKNCLWQFNSRAWDRRKQNAGILGKATQILCDEAVEKDTPADKCYWVDAVCLADAYKSRYAWLAAMDKADIKTLMGKLHERLDWLTIDGSLNEELTVKHY